MLRVDRVLRVEPGTLATAVVSVSGADVLVRDVPCYPAVLLIEAMAQVAALFAEGEGRASSGTLAGLNDFEFGDPVPLGQRVIVTTEHVGAFGRLVRTRGRAEVDGRLCASGEITIAL